MPVGVMLASMTSIELTEWQLFFQQLYREKQAALPEDERTQHW